MTLLGFMILLGSRVLFSSLMTPTPREPNSSSNSSILPCPMPCSPVQVPPTDSALLQMHVWGQGRVGWPNWCVQVPPTDSALLQIHVWGQGRVGWPNWCVVDNIIVHKLHVGADLDRWTTTLQYALAGSLDMLLRRTRIFKWEMAWAMGCRRAVKL